LFYSKKIKKVVIIRTSVKIGAVRIGEVRVSIIKEGNTASNIVQQVIVNIIVLVNIIKGNTASNSW
jgi:hypothetical protein